MGADILDKKQKNTLCNDSFEGFSIKSPSFTMDLNQGRGNQLGCSHFEIRLGKSGYHQHSCDRQFGSFSLFDLVGAYTG